MTTLDWNPEQLPALVELFGRLSAFVAWRYLFFASIAWLLAYVFLKRRWFHRKVIARFPSSASVRREMLYSALTILIFGAVAALTIWAARRGWTRMYWRAGERGWTWFFASVGMAIVLHDAYFYWTHRLMHCRRLFRWFHLVHHVSKNPSPWAAYSFGPLEAFVQAGIFPLMVCLLPLHPIAFALFMVWQITFNVAGHTGYEFHPRWLMDSPLRFVLNTPTNHVMHHENMRGNYGLYFNVWDRLMGTNHAAYEARFREVTSRAASPFQPRSRSRSRAEAQSMQSEA